MKRMWSFLLVLLFCAFPAFAQELPFNLRYGMSENKAATEYSKYTNNPRRVMEKTISITSLQNGLNISEITVNRGNVKFLNSLQKLPVVLNYGQKYEVSEVVDSALYAAIAEAEKKHLNNEETNKIISQAMLQDKDSDVIEIAVSLSDGRMFTFNVGRDALTLAKVTTGKPQQPSAAPATQTQTNTQPQATHSVPPQSASSAAISSFEGAVKTFSDGDREYYEVYDLATRVSIDNLSKLSKSAISCLEVSVSQGTRVKITGKFVEHENGSTSAQPEGLHCQVVGEDALPPRNLKFTEKLHNQYLLDEKYALADTLLNSTWKQVKPNVSDAQYKQILQEQRQWASKGRDAVASGYATSMSEVEAFAKAMRDRTEELAKIVAVEPMRGTFNNKFAEFTAILQGDSVLVEGDAHSEQGNLCSFDGKGTVGNGWITMKHADFPDFYILFTHTGAQIAYTGSGESQGCGASVGFNYNYTKK